MPGMTRRLARPSTSGALLRRLVDAPDLVRVVRALPPSAFSAVVRNVGVADAGEIVALATTEQLVAAFDEDLFVGAPGERESFDASRFVVWLEVLLEAGDAVAAARVAELSEDFVAHALSGLVVVLDDDALRLRMGEGGEDALYADKAIESCLSQEIDGYLLVSRRTDAWDAVLALVLALDRDHRGLLVRVLDRCAEQTSGYLDDLDELTSVLSAEESRAEDVEAEREERRARQGYVEPRAARAFLGLARKPASGALARDALTRAYFRELEPSSAPTRSSSPASVSGLIEAARGVGAPVSALPPATGDELVPLLEALRLLHETAPDAAAARMAELAYLANVLVAGAAIDGDRLRPAAAAEAVIATVSFGARLELGEPASAEKLRDLLVGHEADLLFRKASAALAAGPSPVANGMLLSSAELAAAVARLDPKRAIAARKR